MARRYGNFRRSGRRGRRGPSAPRGYKFDSVIRAGAAAGWNWPIDKCKGIPDAAAYVSGALSAIATYGTKDATLQKFATDTNLLTVAAARTRHSARAVPELAESLNTLAIALMATCQDLPTYQARWNGLGNAIYAGLVQTLPENYVAQYGRALAEWAQQATLVQVTTSAGPLSLGNLINVPTPLAGFNPPSLASLSAGKSSFAGSSSSQGLLGAAGSALSNAFGSAGASGVGGIIEGALNAEVPGLGGIVGGLAGSLTGTAAPGASSGGGFFGPASPTQPGGF